MGTLAELYHHVSATTLVPALNEWRRMWGVASHTAWVERRHEVGIGEGEVPADARAIAFAVCDRSVTWIEAFLHGNQLPSLHACFGYPSGEPDDIYAAPDWPAVRAAIASVLESLRAPDLVTPARFDSLRGNPKIHFTAPTAADGIELVSAFVELADWVLAQPKPDEYFICWSW